MKLITIKTFDNSIDAHMFKSKLESDGIPSFLFDENLVSINPLYAASLGGIKLKVDELDLERALAVVGLMDNTLPTDENDTIITCPNCQSNSFYIGFKSMKSIGGFLSAILSFILMVFPLYYKTVYKCKSCGTEIER